MTYPYDEAITMTNGFYSYAPLIVSTQMTHEAMGMTQPEAYEASMKAWLKGVGDLIPADKRVRCTVGRQDWYVWHDGIRAYAERAT